MGFIVAVTEGKIQATEYETKHWSQPRGWLKDKSPLKYKEALTLIRSHLPTLLIVIVHLKRETSILLL